MLYFNAYIVSTMYYCNTIGGKNCKSDTEKIYNIEKRALRVTLKQHATKNVLKTKELLTFEIRCNYHMALLIFIRKLIIYQNKLSELFYSLQTTDKLYDTKIYKQKIHFQLT
jgi:hypothetical protein